MSDTKEINFTLPDLEMVDLNNFEVDIEKQDVYPYLKFHLKFGKNTDRTIAVSKKGFYKMLLYSQTL